MGHVKQSPDVLSSEVVSSVWQALALVLLATILFYALASVLLARRRRVFLDQRSEAVSQPLEEKLKQIVELSTDLEILNSEIQAELALQVAASQHAKVEADNAVAIAALSDAQRAAAADMVSAQIRDALSKNSKSERNFQVALAVASFVLGITATLLTQILTT
jgi:uncharacterized protein YpmS